MTLQTTLLFVFLPIMVFTQEYWQDNGFYRNTNDFNLNRSLLVEKYELEKASHAKLDNFYILTRWTADHKYDLREILFIKEDSAIYLNGYRLGMCNGFIKINQYQEYSYFKGLPMMSYADQLAISKASINLGITGGIIVGSKKVNERKDDIHYVFNFNNGLITLLSQESIGSMLYDYPDLKSEFDRIKEPSVETLQTYLSKINRRKSKVNL